MHIVEFTAGSLRVLDTLPEQLGEDGFVWVYLPRSSFEADLPALQGAAERLGGSALLELHVKDLASDAHPSSYEGTSVYDLVIFRRLAAQAEVQMGPSAPAGSPAGQARLPEAFARIDSRPVGFAVFDRLLISVHPESCYIANLFMQRFLNDAKVSVDAGTAVSRLPPNPADLVLRMLNVMVDSYLELRKDLTQVLDHAQTELLQSEPDHATWSDILLARNRLHALQDLCEEQQDAVQEWLDTLHDTPLAADDPDLARAQRRRDVLEARARDVIEHIGRVLQHARRLEQSAETAVQIHFSIQGQRANDTMRTLTVITAIFLPLNLFAGFFGMNFEYLPLIHSREGMWVAMTMIAALAIGLVVYFRRRRYLTDGRG